MISKFLYTFRTDMAYHYNTTEDQIIVQSIGKDKHLLVDFYYSKWERPAYS
jgi:hypothetical protein